ncbi:phage minor head protein [uncultured Helicobacter sp.]|uniref:phage head morphogenesis protein n=1 Tax=uncultured Helicobacter sp. TaxID=175537 RepID=UPI00262D2935|nr:phage minor head protein [uncultured Helicobacter sp.]
MVSFNFNLSPEQNIKFLQQKKPELSFNYDEVMHEAHLKAFTIAKVTKLDLLSDMQDSLIKAQKEGKSFEVWKKEIKPTLAKKGWLGKVEVRNEKTGEIKTINVNNTRLQRIYNTNMRTANAQGRAKAQYALEGEIYLRYIALQDGLTRPSHLRMHGITLRRDDPFWETNYPPNGWNCRCVVRAYSKEECERQGFEISKTPPLPIASKDWSYDKRGLNEDKSLDSILQTKLEKFKKNPDKSAFVESLKKIPNTALKKTWETSLNAMIDEVLVKGNQSYPAAYAQVGKISPKIQSFLEKTLGTKLEDLYLILPKNNLLHASPKRKAIYNQALRVEEFREIVNVLEEEKEVYWDKDSLIYFFEDKEDKTKMNKIVVTPNYKIKRFGKTNAIVTLSKIDKHSKDSKKYQEIK